MPYIKQRERSFIDPYLKRMLKDLGKLSPGEFVYIIYQIAQWQASSGGEVKPPINWTDGSRVVADIECAKLEFYRKIIGPYEDEKILENGDCVPINNET